MKFKIIFILLLLPFLSQSQEKQDSLNSPVEVLHMNKGVTERLDGETINYLYGNVQFKQDSVYMFCDTAILRDKMIEAKGNVVIIQEDTVNIYADYLIYNGYLGKATFISNVVLESSEQKLFTDTLLYDTNTKEGNYRGSAILTNASTKLTSINGRYNADTKMAFFQDSVFVLDSLFTLQTDSMSYNADIQKAIFLGPTLIYRDSSEVYCEDGYYLIGDEYALFKQNAQYVNADKKAQADSIIYDGKTEQIQLLSNAKYLEEDAYAEADSILYFEKSENAELRGNAYYRSKSRVASGKLIKYNGKSGSISTGGRTTIIEDEQEVIANQLDYDGDKDVGFASGEVIWRDTVSLITLLSEEVMYKKNEDFVKAYGDRPILIIEIESDSLFIASDTLISYDDYQRNQLIQVDSGIIINPLDSQDIDPIDTLALTQVEEKIDTVKTLVANKRVKIYKSDFQAVCDSLYFNARDSVFHLIGNPIMWSDSSQFIGDTIFVYLRQGKVHMMEIINKGFISSTKDEIFFNQIKGKKVTAFMKEGKVDKMNVKGNAETVYYIMDDSSAYIGVNQLICSEIWVYFKGGQVNRILNLDKPDGHSFPMRGTDHDALKLKDFIWLEDLRPKSSKVLFKKDETLVLE